MDGVAPGGKNSARSRREHENAELNVLARLLPLPHAITMQLDKASVIRLTSSFLALRNVFPTVPNRDQLGQLGHFDLATHMMLTLDGFVFVLDANGRIMYISETASVHLGLSQVELTGNSMFEYVHDGDKMELSRLLYAMDTPSTSIPSSGDIEEIERIFVLRIKCVLAKRNAGLVDDGYKAIHCWGYSRLRDEAGCRSSLGLIAVGYTLAGNAITEIRLSPFMFMFRAALDLRLVFLDSRASHLIGIEAERLLDRCLYQLIHESDSTTIVNAHHQLMCKKQATTGYYRMLTGDGGWVWVQTQLTLMQAQRPCRRSCIIGITSILSGREGYWVLDEIQTPLETPIQTDTVLGSYSHSYYGNNITMLS